MYRKGGGQLQQWRQAWQLFMAESTRRSDPDTCSEVSERAPHRRQTGPSGDLSAMAQSAGIVQKRCAALLWASDLSEGSE
jgi:hypothetical protein